MLTESTDSSIMSVTMNPMQKHLWCKKLQPSKVESYQKRMHEQTGDNIIGYDNAAKT